MCDPLTIAGAVLTLGSVVANTVAARKAESARENAISAFNTQNRVLDQEAAALNAISQDRFSDFGSDQAAKAETLGEFLQRQTAVEPPPGIALPPSSSNLVVQEEDRQRAEARDFTGQSADALARLRSFGDVLGGISREQSRDAGGIGQLGSFKRGLSGILPLQLDAASKKGAGLRTLGDVLSGAGGVATMAGLGGASLFGGSGVGPITTVSSSSSGRPFAGLRG